LFQTLREPPPRGSLRESVLILYVLQKEQIEHARLRALAQGIVNKDKAVEAFEQYQNTAFPWIKTQKRRDAQAHIKLLADEVKKGGLTVRPLWEKPMRSRMKTRIVQRTEGPIRSEKAMNDLYGKLGKVVPVK
jgi:hypothetical protein